MNALTKHESGAPAMSEQELIAVLQTSVYPGAVVPSIKMVLSYCKAAGLDPLQKPVHLVPMWDSKSQQMRDVVMPGVGLYRIQASRTGQFAGMTEPEFGPDVTANLGGQTVTYPEWARVTVKRVLMSGHIAEFTAREYWTENYAQKGGKERSIAPNAMWTKRPRGQIAKCAAAQALRIAFPELGAAPTAEEMEGKPMSPDMELPVEITVAASPETLAAAEEAANRGKDAYTEWWKKQSRETRDAIGIDQHKAFAAQARTADEARTIENEGAAE